jgi:hypothetical protein
MPSSADIFLAIGTFQFIVRSNDWNVPICQHERSKNFSKRIILAIRAARLAGKDGEPSGSAASNAVRLGNPGFAGALLLSAFVAVLS